MSFLLLQVPLECGDKVVRITCWPCYKGVQQLYNKSPRLSQSLECRRLVSRWTVAPDHLCRSIWLPWKSNSSAHIRQMLAFCAKLVRLFTDLKRLWCNINEPDVLKRPNRRRHPAVEPHDWSYFNTSVWPARKSVRLWLSCAIISTAILIDAKRPNWRAPFSMETSAHSKRPADQEPIRISWRFCHRSNRVHLRVDSVLRSRMWSNSWRLWLKPLPDKDRLSRHPLEVKITAQTATPTPTSPNAKPQLTDNKTTTTRNLKKFTIDDNFNYSTDSRPPLYLTWHPADEERCSVSIEKLIHWNGKMKMKKRKKTRFVCARDCVCLFYVCVCVLYMYRVFGTLLLLYYYHYYSIKTLPSITIFRLVCVDAEREVDEINTKFLWSWSHTSRADAHLPDIFSHGSYFT